MLTPYEIWTEKKESRRIQNEIRSLDKLYKLSECAEKMIGQLIRDGKTAYYIWPTSGKYKEGDKSDLINFLIRNNYV